MFGSYVKLCIKSCGKMETESSRRINRKDIKIKTHTIILAVTQNIYNKYKYEYIQVIIKQNNNRCTLEFLEMF